MENETSTSRYAYSTPHLHKRGNLRDITADWGMSVFGGDDDDGHGHGRGGNGRGHGHGHGHGDD